MPGLDILHKRTVRLRTKRAYTGPKTDAPFEEPNTGFREVSGFFPIVAPEEFGEIEFWIDGEKRTLRLL